MLLGLLSGYNRRTFCKWCSVAMEQTEYGLRGSELVPGTSKFLIKLHKVLVCNDRKFALWIMYILVHTSHISCRWDSGALNTSKMSPKFAIRVGGQLVFIQPLAEHTKRRGMVIVCCAEVNSLQ